MGYFLITVFLTLAVSAFCSLLEAMVLSTKPTEVIALKKASKKRGELLEKFVGEIEETSSAILSLNTIANTFGATLSGILFATNVAPDFGGDYTFPAILTVMILVFSEIIPKNIGVLYRPYMQGVLVYPLLWIRIFMWPISTLMGRVISFITGGKEVYTDSDDEIKLLAEKGAKDGQISQQEKTLISNTLSLDDIAISEIMTPRTVIFGLDEERTIGEIFSDRKDLSFARMPVYRETIDNVIGVVRRRDLLMQKANDNDSLRVKELAMPPIFVPENGSALNILRILIKNHQHMGIVIDEYGSLTGVVTLEDIFEHLLGSEIFERDDIAVDMRALAMHRKGRKKK